MRAETAEFKVKDAKYSEPTLVSPPVYETVSIDQFKVVKIGTVTFVLGDCERYMALHDFWDFQLAIVDPPYGIKADKLNMGSTAAKREKMSKSGQLNKGKYVKKSWDSEIPRQRYWDLIFHVSQRHIVWGANYMLDYLGATDCCLGWDKCQGEKLSFDDFEFAWTSFDTKSKILRRSRSADSKHEKIHTTQKPVWLYKKLLLEYAQRGWNVLDTHGGSHTHAIAAQELGINLTICEISEKHHLDGIAALRKAMIVQELPF